MGLRLIRDGYTRTGYIPAVEGLNDALRFTYRPATWPEKEEYWKRDAISRDEKTIRKDLIAFLKGKLISWEDPMECTPENAASLDPPALLQSLLLIISGGALSDSDPKDAGKPAETFPKPA